MNIRNKIISKEEILEIAGKKMEILLAEYRFPNEKLLDFHNKANKINSWVNEKIRRLEKSVQNKKEVSNL